MIDNPISGLDQYLELLGRGAQAAQWGLWVGAVALVLAVVNLVLLVVLLVVVGRLRVLLLEENE